MMKFKVLVIGILLGFSFSGFGQLDYSFYAVYDRLLDSRTQSFNVEDFDFSGDGETIIVRGEDNTYHTTVLYTLKSDGSNLQKIELPEEVSSIRCMGIDSAGSVAFFFSSPSIYRLEIGDGNVTEIFNIQEEVGYTAPNRLLVSGDGNFVFFRSDGSYDSGTIMRIKGDGTDPEVVVYYKELDRDGGYAGGLRSYFSVSHDGSKVAFIMSGYHGDQGFKYKSELFLKDEAGYHQVTNESVVTDKYHAFISGDGSTIVFSESGEVSKWYSIRSDGTGRMPIADKGLNFPGLDVTYDGSMMIHGEGSGNGGCLVATDGSYEREIFSDISLIFNHWWTDIKLSDDGSRICFMYDGYDDGVRTFSLNVGHFNNPFAVLDAPLIEYIKVIPSAIPDSPQAKVLLHTQVSDPQGNGDIKELECDELVQARRLSSSDVPLYFRWEPNDLGDAPDQVAGDGIYSSEGSTRDIVTQFSEAGIRIGVLDHSWTVVVADTVFEISELAAPGKVSLKLPDAGETEVDTAVDLVWESVVNAVQYQAEVSMEDLFDQPVLEEDELLDTSLFVSGLNYNITYYWRVRAHNGVEYGEWSDVSSFTTKKGGAVGGVACMRDVPDLPVVRPNPVYMGERVSFSIPGSRICSLAIFDAKGACIYRSTRGSPVESLSVSTGSILRSEGIYIYKAITSSGIRGGKFQVLER